MSSDIKTNVVYDSVLRDISDHVQYGVRLGGADVSFQTYLSNSSSSSSCNWQITPPSESTCIDRNIIIKSKINFQINIGDAAGANIPADSVAFQYAELDALQAFPLNRLFTTVTASINNVSTSVNNSDILPALLRLLPQDYMQQFHGMTPTYLDNYALFSDTIGKNNSPLDGYGSADHYQWAMPRGAHQITFIKPDAPDAQIGINRYNAGVRQGNEAVSQGTTNYWVIGIQVEVAEPLLCSPFLFNDPKMNNAGFLGINSFQLTMSVDSQMKRFWSNALSNVDGPAAGKYTLKFLDSKPFEEMQVQLKFLTAPLSLVLPPKSALGYTSLVSYVTSFGDDLPNGAEKVYDCNALQLEVIPDAFFIYARQKLSDQSPRSADSFLEIKNISITFGNKSGILSGATQNQLWHISRANKVQQNWYEWKGKAGSYLGVDPRYTEYATTGSVLALDPSFLFGLNPYSASGSIGQYSFQMKITLKRNVANHPDADSFKPEIVVIAARSGVLISAAGSSTLTTSVLNAALVTETVQNDKMPMSSMEYDRLVGGASTAADLPTGGVRSGGVRSGGVKSAGRYSKLSALAL